VYIITTHASDATVQPRVRSHAVAVWHEQTDAAETLFLISDRYKQSELI